MFTSLNFFSHTHKIYETIFCHTENILYDTSALSFFLFFPKIYDTDTIFGELLYIL